ncbi:MAG: 50S ribosomal protein L4 [Chloroflexia bacterium]
MVQATIYNLAGEEVEKIELEDAIFGIKPNHAVVHQAILRQQANGRRGTHDTKTRADVRGGGKKPWRQKGTGRARQGSTRSPQWRHGGVVFGPHPRSYEQDMTRKMRRLAIRSVLSGKMADGQLILVDSFDTLEPRTKAMMTALKSLNIGDKKAVIFTTGTEATLKQAAGNLPQIKTLSAHLLSVVDMLTHDFVVLHRDALNVVTNILSTTGGRTRYTLRGVAASPEAATEKAAPARREPAAKAVVEAVEAAPAARKPAATRKTAEVAAHVEAAAVEAHVAESPVTEAPSAEAAPAAPKSKAASIVLGNVVIAEVHYKTPEQVTLRNDNDLPVDLGGWILRDKNDEAQSFTFPEGVELKPGSTVSVFTDPGHRYTFDSKRPIWNDQGDVVELLNPKGKVVSTFAYGSYADTTEGSEK